MIFYRKQFNSVWSAFKLGKEDVSAVETNTIKHGLRMLLKLNKLAAENKIVLSDSDKAALMNWAALTFESFGSDFIEARVAAENKAKEEAANPQ